MFNYKHYVPILKWKPAELVALKNLRRRKYVTPLIQMLMPNNKKLNEIEDVDERLVQAIAVFEEKIPDIGNDLINIWGKNKLFIDCSLLLSIPLQIKTINKLMDITIPQKTILIPVINLSASDEIKEKVSKISKKHNTGVCVRIVCSDFLDMSKLTDSLEQFVTVYGLQYSDIDIVIDIKDVFNDANKFFNYAELGQKIPRLLEWRTFIFSSGAFPVDLSKYKPGSDVFEPRLDWNSWEKLITKGELKRLPSFSDYTIQHPIYREFTKFLSPSVSIKYTLNNDWHILRGSKGKSEQYLGHANLLANSDEFFERRYSFGDEYIAEKAEYLSEYLKKMKEKKKAGGTGNATTWITASLNHHLECTADQIANLS